MDVPKHPSAISAEAEEGGGANFTANPGFRLGVAGWGITLPNIPKQTPYTLAHLSETFCPYPPCLDP